MSAPMVIEDLQQKIDAVVDASRGHEAALEAFNAADVVRCLAYQQFKRCSAELDQFIKREIDNRKDSGR